MKNSRSNMESNRRRSLMMRALTEELSGNELIEFSELLRNDPSADAEFRRLQAVAGGLRASAARSFGPSFADRVMERLGRKVESRSYSFADFLAPLFYRVAGAALALAVLIGAYNITVSSSGSERTPFEAALGLPSVSVESAYESALESVALNAEQERGEK